MISAGLSLMRALMVLETQIENKRLKATVAQIRQHIESGASLSDALAQHPKVFSALYVAMIRAG
jgi:type II secretory pathway component PulF